MKRKFIGIFLFLILFLSGCFFNLSSNSISFETMKKGFYAYQYIDRENYIINSSNSWQELWINLHGDFSKSNVPNVDFSSDVVVAVFMGRKSSSGFSIMVTDVVEFEDNVTVYIESKSPDGAYGRTVNAFTQPYHIVKFKDVGKPILFYEG